MAKSVTISTAPCIRDKIVKKSAVLECYLVLVKSTRATRNIINSHFARVNKEG